MMVSLPGLPITFVIDATVGRVRASPEVTVCDTPVLLRFRLIPPPWKFEKSSVSVGLRASGFV